MPFPTAGELITHNRRRLVTTVPSATAHTALREMERENIGFLPVLEGKKLVGVVSERDIVRGVSLHHRTLVREIMATRVQTVAPKTRSAPPRRAAAMSGWGSRTTSAGAVRPVNGPACPGPAAVPISNLETKIESPASDLWSAPASAGCVR